MANRIACSITAGPSQLGQKAKNVAERTKETAEEPAQTAKDKLKPR